MAIWWTERTIVTNFGDPSGQRHVGRRRRDTHTADKVLTHGHTLLFYIYRFFASLVHCMLRRAIFEYWPKEIEKSKVFLLGGRFGRSLLCPGRAEKETRGSWPTTGCLPVDRNKLGHDSWRDEKRVWYRTHRHTHGIKAQSTARSPALARTWPPARTRSLVAWSPAGLLWKTKAPKLLSDWTSASISEKVNISWGQRSIDAINPV